MLQVNTYEGRIEANSRDELMAAGNVKQVSVGTINNSFCKNCLAGIEKQKDNLVFLY